MEDKSLIRGDRSAIIPDDWENKVLRHRILVVDDDDDIRRFSAQALSSCGYEVYAAMDGVAGWVALNADHYDLLITDNNMPKLSGIELIKKLAAAHIEVLIILASGAPHPEEAQLRLAATLPKPFTREELLETVQKVLGEGGGDGLRAPRSNGSPVDSLWM